MHKVALIRNLFIFFISIGVIILSKEYTDYANLLPTFCAISIIAFSILDYIQNRSDKNRQLFYITGGYLTKRTNRGWLEFRSILNDKYIITAIHEFVPRLPWIVYKFTQAKAHLLVMKKFEKHLSNLKN